GGPNRVSTDELAARRIAGTGATSATPATGLYGRCRLQRRDGLCDHCRKSDNRDGRATIPEVPMPTVLIADDSAVDRRVVRGLLERAGEYTVVEAADGEEALAVVADNVPDLIVTDLLMPRMDGFA